MKKKLGRLSLSRETLRALEGAEALLPAVGGATRGICTVTVCATDCPPCNTAAC